MRPSKTKAAAFERPSKFNFLNERAKKPPVIHRSSGGSDFLKAENGERRFWPVKTTPAQAKRQLQATMRDLEKLQKKATRGDK